MDFREERSYIARKYKHGTIPYYLHLWARIIKSCYHSGNIAPNNEVPYIPPSCKIYICGKNNRVLIDPSVSLFMGTINIGDKNNPCQNCTIKIGKNTKSMGTHIHLYENNSAVYIGDNCLLSHDVEIWGSDSHSVIDLQSKKLLNYGKEVVIGNHVWFGVRSTILKNCHIGNDCIIGAGAVVAAKFTETNAVIAGNPAKIVKKGISWDSLRPEKYKKKYSQNQQN